MYKFLVPVSQMVSNIIPNILLGAAFTLQTHALLTFGLLKLRAMLSFR